MSDNTTRRGPHGTIFPKVIQVIQYMERGGKGTEEDPMHFVTCYCTLDGIYLGEEVPGIGQ